MAKKKQSKISKFSYKRLNLTWKKVAIVAVPILLIGSSLAYSWNVNNKLQDSNAKLCQVAKDISTIQSNLKVAEQKLIEQNNLNDAELEILNDEITAMNDSISNYKLELDNKDKLILEMAKEIESELETDTGAVEEITKETEDELSLNTRYSFSYSDKELSQLIDDEIDFDSEDYDVEEGFALNDLMFSINNDDFEANIFLEVLEDGIEYRYLFENSLPLNDITLDEELEIDFLGKELVISNWDNNEITYTIGSKQILSEGETIEFNNKSITILGVGDDFAYIEVDGKSEKIDEDNTKNINGVDIKVDAVLDNDNGIDKVILIVGEDVEETVVSGDEYEDDSIWDWKISNHSIGLTLNEDFEDLDEEYSVLTKGENICLPNNYACVVFDGVVEEDIYDIDFKTVTKSGIDYVKASGDFIFDLEDYDVLYINSTGIYDDDYEFITNTEIEIEDTDSVLKVNGTDIMIEEVSFPLDITSVSVSGDDISSKDDDYRTEFGLIIESPDDNVDDNELSISVPEEKLEAELSVY